MPRETIYALSSGPPPSAIAILRISGSSAGEILCRLAGPLPVPRLATLRELKAGDGELLDRALVLWFLGPATATGEDLAELHLHGGRAVIAAVSAAIGGNDGVREAQPGEFTRRAFLNGRIDLAAAEGLGDLLAAETEAQRRGAMAAAGGALGREVEGWRLQLLHLSALIEASIDFAEEGDVSVDENYVRNGIALIASSMEQALARPSAERLRDGIRVVIGGPPNAGKSTLLNALVGRDAAIVSPLAGTTRDRIEVPVAIAGTPILFVDTAGLRESTDPVETSGVLRAEEAIATADILLWLGDDATPQRDGLALRVHARADLPGREQVPEEADISVSATDSTSVAALWSRIGDLAKLLLPHAGEATINLRQRRLISESVASLRQEHVESDAILLAENLRSSLAALDALVGRASTEDMLDMLFASFCVGK